VRKHTRTLSVASSSAVATIGAAILVAWSSFGAVASEANKPLSTAQLRRLERQEARLAAGYQVGKASWYGAEFNGHRTASGQRFDRAALTAAHPTLPLNTAVRVTNLANGRSVTVTVNDRGPAFGDRVIDLSQGAAEQIGMRRKGIATVIVEPLGDAHRIIKD
jgi:rare lipoprotein A